MLTAAILLGFCCFLLAWIRHRLDFLWPRFPDGIRRATSLGDFMKKCETGDLVLFCGTGRLDSALVRAWSASPWTHVGMVIVDDANNGKKYLYHADACKARKNAINGKYEEGIQMNDLWVYLKTYPGWSFHRPLLSRVPLGALKPIARALHGIPFNHDWRDLLRCTFGPGGGPMGSRGEFVDAFFCSQLVAWIYQELGIIDKGVPRNEYHPAYFANRPNDRFFGPPSWIAAPAGPEHSSSPAARWTAPQKKHGSLSVSHGPIRSRVWSPRIGRLAGSRPHEQNHGRPPNHQPVQPAAPETRTR